MRGPGASPWSKPHASTDLKKKKKKVKEVEVVGVPGPEGLGRQGRGREEGCQPCVHILLRVASGFGAGK